MDSINVNYDELRLAAAALERYAQEQRRCMHSAEEELLLLGGQWCGEDYRQIMLEWDRISGGESTSGRLLRELEEQAKDLRWAAQEYEKAGNRAVNRGKRLIG